MTSILRLLPCFLLITFAGISIGHTQCQDCGGNQAVQVVGNQTVQAVGHPNGYFAGNQAAVYGNYQPVVAPDSIDAMYRRNAQLPLGGLFAKDFTRTLTLLGGGNFLVPFEGAASANPTGFDPSTGFAISFAFGRRHNHSLRSEIELALRDNDIQLTPNQVPSVGDDIRAYSILKNFIFDFPNETRLTPYLGAGLGWSSIDLQSSSLGLDTNEGAFTYQAIGGIATELTCSTDFIVEYRFLETSEVNLGNDLNFAYRTHNLFLGLKYEY